MIYLMQEADLAISAAGSTLYELCACGVPTISYTLADNQLNNAHGFEAEGLMPYAGDIRDVEFSYGMLIELLADLWESTERRREISLRMQSLVDGRGAERLALRLGCYF